MADIDLEAANRLRVAMGLKPIESPSLSFKPTSSTDPTEEAASTIDTRSAAAGDNWEKHQRDAAARAARTKQKEAIKRARDAAMRDAVISGKGLADEADDVDTGAWLRQQAKRQKKIEKAARLAAELAAREQVAAEYGERDLAGVKVAHEVGDFGAGEEQILTLKDAEIGEESGDDELENVGMRDAERLRERLELKKRKPVYNPNDDDGTEERGILAHYDSEINGKAQQHFTLDGMGSTREAKSEKETAQKSKGLLVSLDSFLKDEERQPVSDYLEPAQIKMKKPKKKKSKSTRKRPADDDDIFPVNDAPEEEAAEVIIQTKKRNFDDANLIDDDDLQAQLAQQRRKALKKKVRIRPEDLAKQLKEEAETQMEGVEDEEAPGLILDETSEFVSHIEAPEDREEARPRAKSRSRSAAPDAQHPEDEDVEMDDAVREDVEGAAELNGHEEKEDHVGLEEEGTIDKGIGATLSMLRQRRHIESNDDKDLAGTFREYESFLSKKRAKETDGERKARLQRERDRQSGRLDRMSAREREDYARQNNINREHAESRAIADLYNKEYKPNVELKYVDEFGRSMNAKEAFKHLSHQFHGKGSGKQKHEKRLKKIEEEKKREAMSTLDSSQHISSTAMGNKAKKNQQAGVRLQ